MVIWHVHVCFFCFVLVKSVFSRCIERLTVRPLLALTRRFGGSEDEKKRNDASAAR